MANLISSKQISGVVTASVIAGDFEVSGSSHITGSFNVTGSISASSTITANNFIGIEEGTPTTPLPTLTLTTTVNDTDATGSAALSIFDVASAVGILDDVSVMSGVNITASGGTPTVTNISSNTLTLTPGSHFLQNGQSLTFKGASRIATITGTIELTSLSANTATLGFDLEKFLTAV